MTAYEKVISLMYDLKNKYNGEITELSLQKKCCTYFNLMAWSFYVKSGENDFSIYVPYQTVGKFGFYLTNKQSILLLFKNTKKYLYYNEGVVNEIYYNTNNISDFKNLFSIEIVNRLNKLGDYQVIGNKQFKGQGKDIKYMALKIYSNNISLEKIEHAIHIVNDLIKGLGNINDLRSEELYSAQYLFDDYRRKKGNFFAYKRLEEENGGKAIYSGETNFLLGGYEKYINDFKLILRNKDINTQIEKKYKKRITEVKANIPIKTGFYMKIRLKNPDSNHNDEVYNVSPLEEFEQKYYVKSSNMEISNKILNDDIKRNIAKIQKGEFYMNSFEGINFISYTELKDYEQILSVVRVIEELIKESYLIRKDYSMK